MIMSAPTVLFGLNPLILSTVILLLVYGALIADTINRAIVSLLGACIMIISGILTQDMATKAIDANTIGLLTGMMILVSISRRSGLFQYLAILSARQAKASPWGILLILQLTTAVLSALLDNVTTVLLIVPVTLAITRALNVPAYPFLFAEIFASNIGGTATLIGDPPNILIGSLADLSFNAFVVHLTPIILVIMAVQAVIIHFMWGRELHATPEARARIMALTAADAIEDKILLKQSLFVIGFVILGFVFARQINLEPGTIAMLGATVLMLLDNWEHHSEKQAENVHKTFTDVEWITIFFFIGLFITVHGVEVGGLLHWLADHLIAATGGQLAQTGYAILWASAILSAIIDNIPFVATMIPLVKDMAPALGGTAQIEPLWWCLSLGACLGGNGTLIGASANLTVAGIAEREGIRFNFWTYAKTAFPLMLVSIAISHVYVWWRYF
jgi:Na+/H+ antiporter NhaD/arsenite permease-like protein